MTLGDPRILTANGGSSSINLAPRKAGDSLRRNLAGMVYVAADRVPARVMRTDEECMIPGMARRSLGLPKRERIGP